MSNLPLVYDGKDRAVVDQKARRPRSVCPHLCERQVVAEDLHVGDALTTGALDLDVKLEASRRDINNEAPRRRIKRLRIFIEDGNRALPRRLSLLVIPARTLSQQLPVDAQ